MGTLHTALQGKMGSTTLGKQPRCVEDKLPHKVVLTSEVIHNLESPELPYCYHWDRDGFPENDADSSP